MTEHLPGILLFILSLYSSKAVVNADPDRCISRLSSDSEVVRLQYCVLRKMDVEIACPENRIVVLNSLQLAMKTSRSSCMNRVLNPNNKFCCYVQDNDVLYDGHCLKEFWNNEDVVHYEEFMTSVLRKCNNASHCILNADMFVNIQKEIPNSNRHSSYFQINYQCIAVPTKPLRLCATRSESGKALHIQGMTSRTNMNNTCTCRVASRGSGTVAVAAVDVRTSNSGLTLSSNQHRKQIPSGQTSLFGFREIVSGQKVNISLRPGSVTSSDKIWLYISGSRGQEIIVSCGESTAEVEERPSTPGVVPTVYQMQPTGGAVTVFGGYWPVIYLASGSFFTIMIVVFVLGGYKMYSYRQKRKRNHHVCYPPSLPARDFTHDIYGPAYATVRDGTLHISDPGRTTEWYYGAPSMRTYQGSSSMRNIRPHTAPPPPPPLSEGGKSVESLHRVTPGTSSDVSALEAFLECKEADQARVH